jgi:O-antigen/teichoic acid export membrane protein
LAASLAAIIWHHFLEALFAALRKFRVVSAMHFCQSMMFAIVSLTLLFWWRSAADSIIIGYGLACMISVLGALVWNGKALLEVAPPGNAPPHASFWPPLLRFAIWVWVTNLLCHLFAVIDRYMLVHYSTLDSAAALAQVGHYHASRVLPLLFLSVADLLSGVVLPYLSHDWEAGQRQRVADRLILVMKFSSLIMLAAGVVVLWAAPLLFQVAFEGRYDDGLDVLPLTLTYCTWYGLLLLGQTYLWCAERMKTGIIPLSCGLVSNAVLNLALIPAWGLHGAVVSTTIATGFALAVLYWLNYRAGMRIPAGVILLSAALAALSGGVWIGATALAAVLLALPRSKLFFTQAERDLMNRLIDQWIQRVREFMPVRSQLRGDQYPACDAATSLGCGHQPTDR